MQEKLAWRLALPLAASVPLTVLATAEECTASMPPAKLIRALAHGQEEMDWSSVGLVSAWNAGLKTCR